MTPVLMSATACPAPALTGSHESIAVLDRLSGPMTRSQALTLRSLAIEAYQPKQFHKDLTRADAARRIQALRDEIALADSF